jgi:hypothetical protein
MCIPLVHLHTLHISDAPRSTLLSSYGILDIWQKFLAGNLNVIEQTTYAMILFTADSGIEYTRKES